MIAFLIYLPLIFVWIATILFFAVIAWRLLRWVWKEAGETLSNCHSSAERRKAGESDDTA